MYTREKYIKSIIDGLGRLQHELDMLDKINLYDINIISEDFFTGLLNLIYGYELKNANHDKKNTEAVDLVDIKHRIAVQVTHDNSREKISSTIRAYIDGGLYDDYDRLILFLLRSKKNYVKDFDTKEMLRFDIKRDIMDISDLIPEIKALDTERLKAVDAYCAAEIAGYRQRGSKWNKVLCGVAVLCILTLIIFIRLKYIPAAKVYASSIYPYTAAGSFNSYKDFPTLYETEIEVNKAFAIMSSIRNQGDKVSSVEQLYCEILSLEPIEEADIHMDAEIIDNTLYLFAFNNGWGSADAPVVKSATISKYNITGDIQEVCANIHYEENTEVKPAGAVPIAQYELDHEAVRNYFGQSGNMDDSFCNLYIQAEGQDYTCDFWAYLHWGERGVELQYGGMGGPGYKITLFAELDVDQNPSAVYFTGENATPFVEDMLQIETVLAPTKSCIVKCRNVFSINGKRQQTDIYTVKVTVPAFADGAIGLSGLLTGELAQLQKSGELSLDRTVQKYLYHPESVKAGSSDE